MAEEEGRRFSRANRGSRMAVLLSEALEAQAGGSFPRWALLSPRTACELRSSWFLAGSGSDVNCAACRAGV
jgi:hypothetical protein